MKYSIIGSGYAQHVGSSVQFEETLTQPRRWMFSSRYFIRKMLQNLSTWAGYQSLVCGVQESLKTAVYLTFIAQRFLKHIRRVNFRNIALIIFNLFTTAYDAFQRIFFQKLTLRKIQILSCICRNTEFVLK